MENLLIRDLLNYTIENCFVGDIINFNEIVAMKIMREVLASDNSFCHCNACIEDAYALAMNSLPARYIQVTSEEKYTHSKNFITDVTVRESVIKAMEKVRAEPKH